MTTTRLHHRYVSEITWSPSYIGIAVLVLGTVDSHPLVDVAVILALIGCRIALELLYRVVFGDKRLELKTQATALALQVIVWGAVWGWYAHRTSA